MDKRESLIHTLRRILDETDDVLDSIEMGLYVLAEDSSIISLAAPVTDQEKERLAVLLSADGITKIITSLIAKTGTYWASWVDMDTKKEISLALYSLTLMEVVSRQARLLERHGKGQEAERLLARMTLPAMTTHDTDIKA